MSEENGGGGGGGLDAPDEAAQLALKMASAVTEESMFAMEYAEEFPAVGPAFKLLKAIDESVETAQKDQGELKMLLARCIYVTSCVIVKSRRTLLVVDVRPLVECLEDVDLLARRRRPRHERDINDLHDRVGDLTVEMGLAGVVIFEKKVDNLWDLLVSAA